jgi:hypothetical protein
MRRRKKLTHCEAKERLRQRGIDFRQDFFVLRSSEVELIVEAAKATGYRKSKGAPGSRGRMYYGLLQRKRCA